MDLNSAIKIIVFDFDDTLVKSERIKKEAFATIFYQVDGAVDVVRDFVRNSLPLPRLAMIREILKLLCGRNLLSIAAIDFSATVDDYLIRYGKLVEDLVLAAEEVSGAVDTLRTLSAEYPLYLNSATPQDSISRIIIKKNWGIFFKGVYGSPPGTKLSNLRKIIADENLFGREVLVVGDRESDRKSADECDCKFIGVRGEFNNFTESPSLILDNLSELVPLIKCL